MKQNIGFFDRLIRFIGALVLLFLAFWFRSWIFLGFSIFVFYESIVGWCVLYQLIGKSSCKIK